MKISFATFTPLLFVFASLVAGEEAGGGGLRRRLEAGTNRTTLPNPFYGVETPYEEKVEVEGGTTTEIDCMEFGDDDAKFPMLRMSFEELTKQRFLPQSGLIYLYGDGEDPDCVPMTIALGLEEDGYRLSSDGKLYDEEGEEILMIKRTHGFKVMQDDPKREDDTGNVFNGGGGERKLASPNPLAHIIWDPDLIWKGSPCWHRGWTARTRAWSYDAWWQYTNIDHIRTKAYNMALDQDLCSYCHYEMSSKKHTKGCWAFAPWNQASWWEGSWSTTVGCSWSISSGCW